MIEYRIQILNIKEMPISPAEYSSKEMHRNIQIVEKSYPYSRKSSGISEDDLATLTENKISRQMTMKTAKENNQEIKEKKEVSLVARIVQNIYFQIFITLLTLVSLVLYDVKTIFLSKEQDFNVGIVNLVFFSIFMIEITMNIKTEGYFCSFYFYLDLISTVTLLLDVDMITDALFNQSSSSSFQVNSIIAQSKASRAAARAVRVVKIFRLARVAKLYKSTQKARELNQQRKKDVKHVPVMKKKASCQEESQKEVGSVDKTPQEIQHRYEMEQDSIKEEEEEKSVHVLKKSVKIKQNSSAHDLSQNKSRIEQILQLEQQLEEIKQQEEQELQSKESNISKILSDDTIKRIIIIILVLMVSIPLMDLKNYKDTTTQWDFMTSFTAKILKHPDVSVAQISNFINRQSSSLSTTGVYSDILCIDTPFVEISACPVTDFTSFRSSDIGFFYHSFIVSQILSLRSDLTLKQTFVMDQAADSIVVFVNYQRYNRIDASTLDLIKVFSIATTIFICLTIMYLLTSFSNNINQLIISPIEKMLDLVKMKDTSQQQEMSKDSKEEYETQMVQNAIIKIKSLMETIFGSLGNELIHIKMQNNSSIQQNLDQSINRSLCVFVLCQIKHLPIITEVLADDVYGFINQISMLAQNAAYRYGGYCTNILDDGFLMTFKVPKEKWQMQGVAQNMPPTRIHSNYDSEDNTYIKLLCDYALFSVLKILARLCKEPKIFKYRNDQRLLVSFKGAFSVEMSFALNFGWAQEGIVGSSYKIDPLFFGNQINKLNKLVKFNQSKGSSIVLSESFYTNLTNGTKSYCRGLQSIKLAPNQKIQKIYLVDFDTANVTPSRHRGEKMKKVSKDLRTKKEENMLYLENSQLINYNAIHFVNNKKELRQILKKKLSEESKKKYRLAFEHYIRGDWVESLDLLDYQKLISDKNTHRLRQFMKQYKGIAPSWWKGYRQFDEIFNK